MVAFCCGSFIDSFLVGRDNIFGREGEYFGGKKESRACIPHFSKLPGGENESRECIPHFPKLPVLKTKFSLVREGGFTLKIKKVALTGNGCG